MKTYLTIPATILITGCLAVGKEPSGFEFFVGRKLDDTAKQQLAARYKLMTGEELKQARGLSPWWVKKFEAGNAKWMLLLVYPGYDVPDVSYVEAHVFDRNWQRIAKQSFPTGYRMFLKEATVDRIEHLAQDTLVIKTTSAGPFIVIGGKEKPLFEQGTFQRQYYGFAGKQVCLIRLEDDKRKLVRNHFRWKSPSKGPSPPTLNREQWLELLASDDLIEKLSALVWVTGSHLPSTEERKADHNQESLEDSKLFESVRDDLRTAKILRELKTHENPWVKQYARLGVLEES